MSQIGGSSQRFGALIAGRIDVAPLIEPTITAAKQKGFTPLIDLAAANTPWIFDGVVVTSGYLKENRDTLTHFVRAYIAGAYLALSDVEKAKAVIAQKYKTNDPKVDRRDLQRLQAADAARRRAVHCRRQQRARAASGHRHSRSAARTSTTISISASSKA